MQSAKCSNFLSYLATSLTAFAVTLPLLTGCRGSSPRRVDEQPPPEEAAEGATEEVAESANVVPCSPAGVTCRTGKTSAWQWDVTDPRYPDTRTLASLSLEGLVVATGAGEAFAVAVHADADTAARVAAALMGGSDPVGGLDKLGDPTLLVDRALTP